MHNTFCSICHGGCSIIFEAAVLKKYSSNVFCCSSCGFTFLDQPSRWLAEAYKEAIASSDTGLVSRNINLSKLLMPTLFYLFGDKGIFVDIAGGTGLFVRLMRDIGFDYYWTDPYCKNVHATGFEFQQNTKFAKISCISAFEVFEHIEDPLAFITDQINSYHPDLLAFTTELVPGDGAPPDWWYFGFTEGQHISFFSRKSLEIIADKLNLIFISNGYLHFFCKPELRNKINKITNSKISNRLNAISMKSHLRSKTFSDHIQILELNTTKPNL